MKKTNKIIKLKMIVINKKMCLVSRRKKMKEKVNVCTFYVYKHSLWYKANYYTKNETEKHYEIVKENIHKKKA